MSRLNLIMSLAICSVFAMIQFKSCNPDVAGNAKAERAQRIAEDRNLVANILLMYAQEENQGQIPPFRSDRLPNWWAKYGSGAILQPGVRYYLDPSFENRRVSFFLSKHSPIESFEIGRTRRPVLNAKSATGQSDQKN